MNSYYGNDKPYVYVCCNKEDDIDGILNGLDASDIALCLSENFDAKEEKRIDAAYGVLFLISRNLLKNQENFSRTLEYAVAKDKKIASVYLEDVEMAPSMMLQIDLRKFMFADRFKDSDELVEYLKKQAIFTDMKVTDEQIEAKKKTKNLMYIALGAIGLLILVMLFSNVPKVSIPVIENIEIEKHDLSQFGLNDLSNEELQNIKTVYMIGDTAIEDPESISSIEIKKESDETYSYVIFRNTGTISEKKQINLGTISDLSALKKLPNLESLCLAFEDVKDLSALSELKNLAHLDLRYNPISSLEGIEGFENLVSINLDGTPIKDVKPLFGLEKLRSLSLSSCQNVSSIDGIEESRISELNIYGTSVDHIDDYASIDGECSFILNPLDSYEFLAENTSYANLALYDVRPYEYIPYLMDAEIENLSILDDDIQRIYELEGLNVTGSLAIDSNTFYSLYGINYYFPYLDKIDLRECYSLIDFYPLINSNISTVIIKKDQRRFVDSGVMETGKEVYYEDEGKMIRYYE